MAGSASTSGGAAPRTVDLACGVVSVLTISSGHSVAYLTNEVAAGRENYYTGAVTAGEPPGRWYGTGAELLGLSGLVDPQDMTTLYERFLDPRDEAFGDPERWDQAATLGHTGRRYLTEEELYTAALEREPNADAERRAELRTEAGKNARHNVSFLDATFSVQKSVTVLHTAFEAEEVKARQAGDDTAAAAWGAHRQAVEDAIWAGNRAGLDYLAKHAGYSRVGHHGGAAGRFVDAHDWTIASFFQHDSREHDPQLHIHNAILNRVPGPDAEWRTLHGRALYTHRGAAGAVAERTTEEYLAHSLNLRAATRPDGKAREVLGVSADAMGLFSSRRRAVTAHTRGLLDAFETKFGREPNSLELDRLQRQATFATRSAKSHDGESTEARLERWDAELRAEVADGLAGVAQDVLEQAGHRPEPERWSPKAVIETALADVQATKATWTAPDLTRAISDALPDHLGITDGAQIAQLLDELTAEGLELAVPLDATRPGEAELPDELRLANGYSAYQAPGERRYATPDHVHSERILQAAASSGRTAPAMTGEIAKRFVASLAESGIELGADQAAAVRGVLTSGAPVESLVGPAGTGKSFVLGTVAKAWSDAGLWDGRGHRVVGLAASQVAADVLAGEGLAARNITAWLGAQRRLVEHRPALDDESWGLNAGDLVVVDESTMADTNALSAIQAHADAVGAKLLLTGDHRQLTAVGPAGGMELAAGNAPAYELTEARRFTQPWERDASLRLRAADQSVLGEYHKHGRLLDSGTTEQAEASAARAWLADTLDGQRSLLIVDTNEQAARLSAWLRAELVRLGRVAEDGVPLDLQGTYAGAGDIVQARLNGWHLAGHDGNRRGPINRENYRVIATREDGGMTVSPLRATASDESLGERITLPPDYVHDHLALGHASTVHAAQGTTVDTSHSVITGQTGPEALYVGMSRGRDANTAHVATRTVPTDPAQGTDDDGLHRNPTSMLADTLDTADPARSALATAVESAQDTENVRTPAELLADASELATAGRTARWLDELVDNGQLRADQRAQLAAEDGAANLSRLLRRTELAGHDPQRVLTDAIDERPLDGARQLTNVIHHRITASDLPLDQTGETYTDWIPAVDDPEWRQYLSSLADAADTRRHELGQQVATDQPQWAIEEFGLPPTEEEELDNWCHQVSAVAAHRELTGHEDPETAIGAAPKPGQAEEYASWRAAWRALGRPEADRDELEMSDGQLRVRIRAYDREKTWAPRYVADELAGTTQTAEQHRNTAALRRAEAATSPDPMPRSLS